MKKKRVNKSIEAFCKERKYCRVTRKISKNYLEYEFGFIVDFSDKLLLMLNYHTFAADGYLVFPREAIIEVRHNETDVFINDVLKKEQSVPKELNKYKPDLTSWASVFQSLKQKNINIAVENEHPDYDNFGIGPIEEVKKKKALLRHFDAAGVFEKELSLITYKLITLLKFDDTYINTYSKYLKESK